MGLMDKVKNMEYKWKMFFVTAIANFVCAFAINSINLALPVLVTEFGVDQGTVSWLSLIYSFVPSATLLIFGRLADLYGYKKQFVNGFIVFGLGSLLLPLISKSFGMILFFRLIQGIGYGMLISITQAMCNKTFPPEERGTALGVNSVFVSVGLACGPTISGVLMEFFSWKSIFYFNVPFSVLGIYLSYKILHNDVIDETKDRRMDWMGSVFFAVGIGILAYTINQCDDWGLTSPRFFLFLSIAVISIALFIIRETKAPVPLMQLSLFKNKVFTLSNLASMFSYMAQQLTTFLTPFFLMNILLLSKSNSGFVMLLSPLAMIIASPLGGKMTDRCGSKKPSLLGLGFLVIALTTMVMVKETTPLFVVMIALLFFGSGNGYSVSAINASIYSVVPKEVSGMASGMVATMRNLGQGLGVAFATMIIAFREKAYIASMMTGESTNATYLLAQRDTFVFGLCIVIMSMVCVLMTPNAYRKK